MCQHVCTVLAERVVEACENQICESRGVTALHMHSQKNCLERIKQLVQDASRVGKVHVEKPGLGSGDNGGRNDLLSSPGEFEFHAEAGVSFL